MPRILVTPAPRPAANAAPVTPPMPEQPPAVSAPVTPAEQPDADDPFGDDTAARLVASLYREYQREPVTHEIRDTLKYNGLPHSDGSCRGARIRAKKAMPELAAYPTRLTVTA